LYVLELVIDGFITLKKKKKKKKKTSQLSSHDGATVTLWLRKIRNAGPTQSCLQERISNTGLDDMKKVWPQKWHFQSFRSALKFKKTPELRAGVRWGLKADAELRARANESAQRAVHNATISGADRSKG
jgi:hypothetical protein